MEEREHNNCDVRLCRTCAHAAAIRVERSSSSVRCGCKGGVNFDKWTWIVGEMECPDYRGDISDAWKKMVNLAWELSAERKRLQIEYHIDISNTVEIEQCRPHFGRPFKEVGA